MSTIERPASEPDSGLRTETGYAGLKVGVVGRTDVLLLVERIVTP